MAKKEETENQAEAEDQPQVEMRILAQYVRDLSFENILSQKGLEGEVDPSMSVAVNLDARKRTADNTFEVLLKLNVKSDNKVNDQPLFLLELDYAGVFYIDGVPEDQMHPFLLIECPRMLFPFARRIVSDMTRDGGFPPVNLDNIDFVQLYRNEILRRQAEQKNGKATS